MLTTEYLNNKTLEANIARFKQAKQDMRRYELILADLRESQSKCRRKNPSRSELLQKNQTHYYKATIDYQDSQGQLAVAFYTLSTNIIRYRKFNFVDQDDAIQEFVLICFEKIDRFDPKKGKAFNYMTTCILNSYRQLYRTARNYNELKRKYHGHLQARNGQIAVRSRTNLIARDKFARG